MSIALILGLFIVVAWDGAKIAAFFTMLGVLAVDLIVIASTGTLAASGAIHLLGGIAIVVVGLYIAPRWGSHD